MTNLASGVIIATAVAPDAHPSPGYDPRPTYPQEEFPCQEDEVLGYSPSFGPDRVGCIHIDEIRNGG